MGGEPKEAKKLPVDDGSGIVERATVRPQFSVDEYANEADEEAGRPEMPTMTDDLMTEQARLASVLMDSLPPAAGLKRLPAEPPTSVAEPEDVMLKRLRQKLSPLSRVPRLTKSISDLGAMIDDPKTAYILGFVDGLLPLETIVDVAGLPELDILRILDRAVENGAVSFVGA